MPAHESANSARRSVDAARGRGDRGAGRSIRRSTRGACSHRGSTPDPMIDDAAQPPEYAAGTSKRTGYRKTQRSVPLA